MEVLNNCLQFPKASPGTPGITIIYWWFFSNILWLTTSAADMLLEKVENVKSNTILKTKDAQNKVGEYDYSASFTLINC